MTPGLYTSPTVSVFIDGAPFTSGLVEGIGDLDRIEVLKGPQSATFGREAFAGAINLVTKIPSDKFGGSIDILGSNDETDDRVSLEGPIFGDKLTFRISGRYYDREGNYTNEAQPQYKLGDESTKSLSLALHAVPYDNLVVNFFASFRRDNDGPAATATFAAPDYNCNAGAAAAGTLNYICGSLPNAPKEALAQNTILDSLALNTIVAHNASGVTNNLYDDSLGLTHGGLLQNVGHGHLGISYELPYGLTLTSLSAANIQEDARIYDYDGRNTTTDPNPYYGSLPNTEPYTNWLFNFQDRDEDYSEELRLSSSNPHSPLRWSVGANYLYAFLQTSASGLTPFGPGSYQNGNPQVSSTTSVFFSVAYDLTSAITLNLEGRYQSDNISVYLRGDDNGPSTKQASAVYGNFVPRAIIQYHFMPHAQIYASYSMGINPGAFNTALLGIPAAESQYLDTKYGVGVPVRPEKLQNYELGVKGLFFNDRFEIQADVYRAIWSDQLEVQSAVAPLYSSQGMDTGSTTLLSVTSNAGSTDLTGFEVEGALKPIQYLTLEFSASINDSQTKNYACTNCEELTGVANYSGYQLPSYSKYSASISGSYERPLNDQWNWYSRLDYSYKSGQFDTVADLAETQPINLLDVHAGFRNANYQLEAFVTNLLDCKSPTGLQSNVDVLSPGFSSQLIEASLPLLREEGVRLRYTF